MSQIKDESFKPMLWNVLGSTGTEYNVTNYRPNLWRCTCKDYLYRSHDKNGYSTNHKCKHILNKINELKKTELE